MARDQSSEQRFCAASRCRHHPSRTYSVCDEHICAVSLNKKYRELACPGYNDGLAYCSKHRCKGDRCTKPRLMDFEDDSDFCRRHDDDARKADAYKTSMLEEDAETSFSGLESHVSSRRGGARGMSVVAPMTMPSHSHRDSAVDVDAWRHSGRA
ncbi:hypothetical protein AC579_4401 [Pseudocercospora musae]|uniref:Uncharacterized protein n=1 Tax=Pseudocercospora musae TaxID=113226 RepID=A0A139HEW0_9PEZI|nr:hypothetical protein AC579_4401 [Pseudocercospora musae]